MPVEPRPVDLEHLERIGGELAVDPAPPLDLGEVTDPAQQTVRHPRRAPGATGDLLRAVGIDLDVEDPCGAQDDLAKVRRVVVLEPVADAEAVAQWRRQQSSSRGRADQGERGQVEGHRARARTLSKDDGQPPVLHRRVERFLHGPPQAVDLVDEEHAAWLEPRQECGDVGLALERGPRGLHHRHLELRGDDVGERGLAQAGRAGEQHVVERLAPPAGRLDEDPELLGDLSLVDEILELRRPQRSVEVVVRADGPGVMYDDLLVGDAGGANSLARLDAHAAPAALRRADCTISSGLAPSAPERSFSASGGV